jgi:hypothetical protein
MAPRAAATVAAATASPVGLALSKTHEIGPLISKGQFGEVYAVENGGEKKKSWVVKVVPFPTKTTKKQTSAAEIAYRRLYYEYLTYTNCRKWSGSLLPLLPSKVTDKLDLYYDNVGGTFGGSPLSCWPLPDHPLRQKSLTRTMYVLLRFPLSRHGAVAVSSL